MNTDAVIRLARQLAETFDGIEGLLSSGHEQTDFTVMVLRKKARVLSADLQAALKEPLKIKPWTPFNMGSAE